MVRGMTRRMHRLEGPALAPHDVAVAQDVVGSEIMIAALLDLGSAPVAAMRAVAVGRGARRRLEGRCGRGMVEMGVGDQDMRHRFARDGFEQRRAMRVMERTGIDRSEEHTSELPSLMRISYAVVWLTKD